MKRTPLKRKATKRSKAGLQALMEFKDRWYRCWFCGAKASAPHHIVFRRGLIYDDQRNLAAVCLDCHSRIHGITIVSVKGGRMLPIPLETVLMTKRTRDPEFWDLAFLRELAGRLDFGEELE